MAVFRADVPSAGTSSINWSTAGSKTANGVITAVDALGRIKILAAADRVAPTS